MEMKFSSSEHIRWYRKFFTVMLYKLFSSFEIMEDRKLEAKVSVDFARFFSTNSREIPGRVHNIFGNWCSVGA